MSKKHHARWIRLCGVITLLPCMLAGPAAADETAAAPKVLHLQVRVDIAADGNGVATAEGKVPEALRSVIEKQVDSWKFQPAMRDGLPVAATTWVRVATCMVPDGDKVRVSSGYEGNGPYQSESVAFGTATPPPVALIRKGMATLLHVSYTVQPDGKGAFESVEFDDSVPDAFRPWFEQTMKQLVKAQRYQPERVEGVPVATRMRLPVHMELAAGGASTRSQRAAMREQQQLSDQLSPACRAAAGQQPEQAVALDSPVRLLEASAPGG